MWCSSNSVPCLEQEFSSISVKFFTKIKVNKKHVFMGISTKAAEAIFAVEILEHLVHQAEMCRWLSIWAQAYSKHREHVAAR